MAFVTRESTWKGGVPIKVFINQIDSNFKRARSCAFFAGSVGHGGVCSSRFSKHLISKAKSWSYLSCFRWLAADAEALGLVLCTRLGWNEMKSSDNYKACRFSTTRKRIFDPYDRTSVNQNA